MGHMVAMKQNLRKIPAFNWCVTTINLCNAVANTMHLTNISRQITRMQ